MSYDNEFQPFECQICRSRFTRRENLKRHAVTHYGKQQDTELQCEACRVTFSRKDLKQRHMRRKHGLNGSRRSPMHDDLHRSDFTGHSGSIQHTSHAAPANHLDWTRSADSHQRSVSSSIEIEPTNDCWSDSRQFTLPISSMNNSWQDEHLVQFTSSSLLDSQENSRYSDRAQGHSLAESDRHTATSTRPNLPIVQHSRKARSLERTSPSSISDNTSNFSHDQFDNQNGRYAGSSDMSESESLLSTIQEARGYELFMQYASRIVPFLHLPSLHPARLPSHLALSMLSLGYQYGGDPETDGSLESGHLLALKCFEEARNKAISAEEHCLETKQKLELVQTYWILEILAVMFLGSAKSSAGLEIHTRAIALIRTGGLAQPVSIDTGPSENLDAMWRAFIDSECHKRIILAVHQLDTVWYQLFSIPRALSHLEIKHDLPCPEEMWTAPSAAQWAHWQLFHGRDTKLISYAEAVRTFVTPDKGDRVLPACDLFGVVNIILFLLSSVRETSGWAAMSGQLSLERFQPLRSSLEALEASAQLRPSSDRSTRAVLCEATWQTAMIELQMWSLSHTSGLVLGSVNALLQQATNLAMTDGIAFTTHTASMVQPHIEWYLSYLSHCPDLDCEAPWIALYAFQVFLIAWQLLHGAAPSVMRSVNINDGDSAGALLWAKKVFRLRYRTSLSSTFSCCLERLAERLAFT